MRKNKNKIRLAKISKFDKIKIIINNRKWKVNSKLINWQTINLSIIKINKNEANQW
jgi:hypothetical protein